MSAGKKVLMQGNAAIARGAYEAGVAFAAGYPGTPSTEILENIAEHYPEIDAQWAANEKVAFDEGMGAAIGGKRALVTMKHVGLNVAADSFMVFSYSGTNAGFVVVSAQDPGMYSSQNEQDNRYFAKFGKVPVIEPSNAQEAKDYLKVAFEISEKFNTPVMYRTTMRLAHTKSVVELGERVEVPVREYKKDIPNWVVPIWATPRRFVLEEKLARMQEFNETFELNRIEEGTENIGVITSGVAYYYAKEAMPNAHFFKLAMTNPLPKKKIMEFCQRFEKVYVVEEEEPFLETEIKSWGVPNIIGKGYFPLVGEYNPDAMAKVLYGIEPKKSYAGEIDIPPRPPQFCSGCPHRGVFYTLGKMKDVLVTGDIGCYIMGSLPPFNAIHTTFCMGASIGNAFGFSRAGQEKVVAVIGDSTFVHGGIPSLIDAVYNKGKFVTMILDNSTTGMTGHQNHPATGKTLRGQPTKKLDIEALVKTIGVEFVKKIDPYNLKETEAAIKEALAFDGPAVLITTRPCALLPEEKNRPKTPYRVQEDKCTGCGSCVRVGCPSITLENKLASIDKFSCTGCGVCAQVCPKDAIVLAG